MRIVSLTQKLENLACTSPLVYKLTMLYYQRMIKKEVSLANITSKDRVLCIGAGPCPYTAILINQYTGAKVRIVDKDPAAVEYARKLIEKLNLTEDFEILHCDGQCVELADCSVIHIALQVSEKDKVFNHIKEGINENTRILVRLPKKNLRSLYSSFTEKCFAKSKKVAHGRFVNVGCTAMYQNSVS